MTGACCFFSPIVHNKCMHIVATGGSNQHLNAQNSRNPRPPISSLYVRFTCSVHFQLQHPEGSGIEGEASLFCWVWRSSRSKMCSDVSVLSPTRRCGCRNGPVLILCHAGKWFGSCRLLLLKQSPTIILPLLRLEIRQGSHVPAALHWRESTFTSSWIGLGLGVGLGLRCNITLFYFVSRHP